MLHDNALSNLYQQIIEAILVIFKSLGPKTSLYVNQVIPQMIQITETCKVDRREFFLSQFGVLASIIRHQLQPYIKPIFELIHVNLIFTYLTLFF
jgi:FKBP12-rapamycin complex-associated protein